MYKEFIKGYEISSVGVVRNITTGRVLKHSLNSSGFHRITIKNKHYAVHRLIALAYIPNPKKLPNVIFKDLDKEHFSLTNIEWSVEQKDYSLQYARKRKYKNIKVMENLPIALKWNKRMTAKEAAKLYNLSISTIYAVRKGKNLKRFNDSKQ